MPSSSAKNTADFLINQFNVLHVTSDHLIPHNGVHFDNTLLRNISNQMIVTRRQTTRWIDSTMKILTITDDILGRIERRLGWCGER
jgi:hypothetical protein